MRLWRARYDWKAGVYRHRTAGRFGHALVAPLVANVFSAVGISTTLWQDGEWLPIHTLPSSIIRFEVEHGLASERGEYNDRHLCAARERRATVRGDHAGYSDVFAPIVARGEVLGVLVAGPFATTMPSSSNVLERWRKLTGRAAHLADPEFAWYLRETLGILVLDSELATRLERLLSCFAKLMAGAGRADTLVNQANVHRRELEEARMVERTWHAVRMMIDERSAHSPLGASSALERSRLGLTRTVDHVLVGLVLGSTRPTDPVDEAIRRNAFQRRAVALSASAGDVVSGQVGDHGVVFLCGARGSAVHQRAKVRLLAERVGVVARKDFGLTLRYGAAPTLEGAVLSQSYHSALAAAESALISDRSDVTFGAQTTRPTQSLRDLREDLARFEERPAILAARFDRYLEAVAVHCGYRLEPAQAHLEVGFEQMASGLLEAGLLEPKGFATLQSALSREASASGTMNELFGAYRRAVADVSDAVVRPVQARRDRSLRSAIEYMHHHYTKSLPIEQVARVAGFTRSHFSRLFIRRERVPFEDYVRGLRIEHAQRLLTDTNLGIARIAELSGFNSPQYFCRVFRRAVGATPGAFRRPTGPSRKSS